VSRRFRRAFNWWFFAEYVCSRLSTPSTDVGASDRQFERLLEDSRLWSFGARRGASLQAAWSESQLRSWMRAATRGWSPEPAVRLRVVGWIMAVGAVTTVLVQTLRPSRMDPLGWTLPAAIASSGVVVSFAAGRIARATNSDER
jgi:hypothetical protein